MQHLHLFLVLFCLFTLANGQYPNTIYELHSDDDYDYDNLDEDDDYLSDQPFSKRKFDDESLQDHLLNAKSSVIRGNHVSTIKDRNFTWVLLKKKDFDRSKGKAFAMLKKTTDWFDADGIQSDQPSPSPILDSDTQTVKPIDEKFIRTEKEKKLKYSNVDLNPPYDPFKEELVPIFSREEKPVEISKNQQQRQYSGLSKQKQQTLPRQQYPIANQQPFPDFNQQPFPSKEWKCQITHYDNCSITNDILTGTLFQHKNFDFFSTGQPVWYLILNTTTVPPNKIGGRLITPYIPFNKANRGCLKIDYITTGDEIDKVVIHQQDIDNRCLWASSSSEQFPKNPGQPVKNSVELSIDFHNSDPRFFIEVFLKRLTSRQSSFALAKLNLTYNQPCLEDQVNYCASTSSLYKRNNPIP